MDLNRFLPNFGNTAVELTEEELDEQDLQAKKRRLEAGRLGPRRMSHITNGQIRRMQIREAATAQRKANKRYRRDWLRAEGATASLKAKVLIVLGITPSTPDLLRNVHLGLIRDYGTFDDQGNVTNDPVEAALEHLNTTLGTRDKILAGGAK